VGSELVLIILLFTITFFGYVGFILFTKYYICNASIKSGA